VYRSSKHIYAQVINDDTGETLAFVGTLSKDVRDAVGRPQARRGPQGRRGDREGVPEKGITKVVFDRNGYVYQANNRVGVLADARAQGRAELLREYRGRRCR
jgi:large subunit ribosomal protein L18